MLSEEFPQLEEALRDAGEPGRVLQLELLNQFGHLALPRPNYIVWTSATVRAFCGLRLMYGRIPTNRFGAISGIRRPAIPVVSVLLACGTAAERLLV